MKASKRMGTPIDFILIQAEDGDAVAVACGMVAVSDTKSCCWRKNYAGLMAPEIKRLRQPQEENARPK